MRCPHCHATVADDAVFCPHCGHLYRPARCDVHPERPAVGRCVLCERAVCDACATDGHAVRCPQHTDVPVVEGWAQVTTANGEIEAQLLAERLRAAGIDAQIFSQQDHAFGVLVGDLGLVRVLVPAADYRRAREVLAEEPPPDEALAPPT